MQREKDDGGNSKQYISGSLKSNKQSEDAGSAYLNIDQIIDQAINVWLFSLFWNLNNYL